MKNRSILNTTRVSFGAALAMIVAGGAAAETPVSVASQGVPGRLVADVSNGGPNRDTPGSDLAQSRNAARSRMRECGHQWSAMKKNGSANGMTWKDFSQGCLAKQ